MNNSQSHESQIPPIEQATMVFSKVANMEEPPYDATYMQLLVCLIGKYG
jgi:hypothetical protein